jgi:competence protein ComEA
MNRKEILKDYLNFSRKERIAAIVIVFLIFLIWFSPRILHTFNKQDPYDSSWFTAIQTLETKQTEKNKATKDTEGEVDFLAPKKESIPKALVLFDFDPNSASIEDWEKLGLREKTIHTIKNFLAHGAHFKKPEDLKKIYGLTEEEYLRLEPHIKIKKVNENLSVQKNTFQKNYSEKKVSRISLDINSADTTEFIALPGIGSKLASRIVNFRDKLGGFYSIDQVGETYGLNDSTFQMIKSFLIVTNIETKKININTATKDELKVHPYLRWNLANAIVEYRNQHGNFSSVDDLKKISVITDDQFEKMKHYLTVN